MGCPTVLIGGLPASRIGDNHVCPMVTGIVPHVGGPFILGAFTVLVGGMPQSRVGDMLICVGPPDTAVMGQSTVLVGMSGGGGFGGLMKGLIMAGLSMLTGGNYPSAEVSSILGCPGYVTKFSPNITIEGTAEFQAKAVRDLQKIASTKTGKALLQSLQESGKNIRIHTDAQVDAKGRVRTGNYATTDPTPSGSGPWPGYKGGGSADAQVGYSPDRDRLAGVSEDWANPPNRPPDVGLFHELVHCDDFTHGELDNDTDVPNGSRASEQVKAAEARAVGLPPYQNEPFSEDAYREELGVKIRPHY
jgi:uncharacterized Zn-binding protein involved in type VI secretion